MTSNTKEDLLLGMRSKILTSLDSFQKMKQECEGTDYDYQFELSELILSTKILSQKIDFDIACFYDDEFEFEEIV